MDDKKLLFIVNPRAGKTKSLAPLFDAAAIYSEAGYLVSVRLMASDWMTQKLLGMYLDDGIYYTSLLKFRDVYRTNRDLVC